MPSVLKIKSYWPASLWALFIFILTILPKKAIPEHPDWGISMDKLVHFGLFVVLGFLILKGGQSKGKSWSRLQLTATIIMLTLYGMLLESLQILVPDRNFSWADLFADFLGVLAGCFIFYMSFNWFRKYQ